MDFSAETYVSVRLTSTVAAPGALDAGHEVPQLTIKQVFNRASMLGFSILAEMANKFNTRHGAHRLWTMPVSIIGSSLATVVSTLTAVVQLVVAPFFLTMALTRFSIDQNTLYWADLALFSFYKGLGTLITMPLTICATTIAPHFALSAMDIN